MSKKSKMPFPTEGGDYVYDGKEMKRVGGSTAPSPGKTELARAEAAEKAKRESAKPKPSAG